MKKILLLIALALTAQTIKAQADAFITTWVTTTGFETLTLSAQADAPNYTINWGDGFTNNYTATQVPTHTYFNSGEHTVSFTGTFPHLTFSGQTKLKAVQKWGTQKWTSLDAMFAFTSLNSIPSQAPDLSICTSMVSTFVGANSFNQPIDNWDVSNVTNMQGMFSSNTIFNQPIGSWNVSKVTDMSSMFGSATAFNQPIGAWNVSSVTNMIAMFYEATAFDQPLGSWNMRNVTNMGAMFGNAKLSTTNYDNLLIGLAIQGANGGLLQQKVNFSGGNSNYCNASGARDFLINTYKWVITDGGANCTNLGTEAFDTSSLKLYPNPVISVLNLENKLTNQTYNIIDALGKVILKGNLNEGDNSINVEQLSKGIYYLKVANNKARKFIKE
jgi:surface protein